MLLAVDVAASDKGTQRSDRRKIAWLVLCCCCKKWFKAQALAVSVYNLDYGGSMMSSRLSVTWTLVVACFFSGWLIQAAHAEPIVILEESFESPVVSESSQSDPPGWGREHGTSTQLYSGLWNENSGRFTTPYGEQVLAVWSGNTVTTTNIAERLQPGATYTLTFNVGNADSDGNPGINHYRADILAGTNVIATTSGQTDTNNMSENDQVSITTDGEHPHLGEVLGVRFAHDGGGWEWRTLIDNVLFVVEETDEWKHTFFIGK